MCIPFKANGVLKPKEDADSESDREESKEQKAAVAGQDKLMAVLFKYARKFMDKKG